MNIGCYKLKLILDFTPLQKLYCTLTNIQCISCADDNNKHYLSQQQRETKILPPFFVGTRMPIHVTEVSQ